MGTGWATGVVGLYATVWSHGSALGPLGQLGPRRVRGVAFLLPQRRWLVGVRSVTERIRVFNVDFLDINLVGVIGSRPTATRSYGIFNYSRPKTNRYGPFNYPGPKTRPYAPFNYPTSPAKSSGASKGSRQGFDVDGGANVGVATLCLSPSDSDT